MSTCTFIPPFLLQRLAEAPDQGDLGQATLDVDTEIRRRRREWAAAGEPVAAAPVDRWTIYSADNTQRLPGDPVRSDGDETTGDAAVDEAYDGVQATWALMADVFSYRSVDGHATPVTATVHYGRRYANAFWDGRQLVFGDGDGQIFTRFTKPIDVLAHEFAHGITQHTAALAYEGQSGALNESVSDVIGAMVKQRVLRHTSEQADWLVGEGLFMPDVQGTALRSMRAPGTAYDDPRLGKDPQVGSMADYVETTEDNGGVHINSGIPNRAFYLAATALGGHSWESAGPIWWAALTGGAVKAHTEFAGFAQATVDAAITIHGEGSTQTQCVRRAWTEVGVLGGAAPGGPARTPAGRTVHVSRSGGFAGITQQADVDVDADPVGGEVADLLAGIDLAALSTSAPQPDRYVYTVRTPDQEVQVAEQDLTPDLSRLIRLVLGE